MLPTAAASSAFRAISIQAIYHIRIENYAEGLRTPLSQLEISRLDYIVHLFK